MKNLIHDSTYVEVKYTLYITCLGGTVICNIHIQIQENERVFSKEIKFHTVFILHIY